MEPAPLADHAHGRASVGPGRPSQGGIGKLSANVVVAPLEHHALILSPFYALTRTTPITVFDNDWNPTRLPMQTFRGYGTELGYRYYSDRGGLRGVFAGPSLIIGSFTAYAENGTEGAYLDYGFAVDVGYQALVVDRVSLSLGAGPAVHDDQQADPRPDALGQGLREPRCCCPAVLISIGWAL